MEYGPGNVEPGTRICDMDAMTEVRNVLSLDTTTGEIVCSHEPPRVADGEFVFFKVRFTSIRPVIGVCGIPSMFLCSGRKPDATTAAKNIAAQFAKG